jgi:hypothetical protein
MKSSRCLSEEENVTKMFHKLNVIVYDLRNIGHKMDDEDYSHRFLRCFPSRFDTREKMSLLPSKSIPIPHCHEKL